MKTYVLCGLSNRALSNFVAPLRGSSTGGDPATPDFSAESRLVAIMDADEPRVRRFNDAEVSNGREPIPYYPPSAFDAMLREMTPDVVLIASPDSTHAEYIHAALRHGIDVITEKPMTATAREAAEVLRAADASEGRLTVAHNLRYSPRHQLVKQLISEGAIGRVVRANLDYHVDTAHGASYFLRWNRLRRMSGGLSVHKSCHHIDLMSWLIDDEPSVVYAQGGLNFYGPEGAHRPIGVDGDRFDSPSERRVDPYYLDQLGSGRLPDEPIADRVDPHGLPYTAQYPAGHDMYLYDREIDIEDTYTSVIGFSGGASLAYSIDFSSPWEGYSMSIVGTHGQIEASFGHDRDGELCPGDTQVILRPLFGESRAHPVPVSESGHDGADAMLQADLFGDAHIRPELKLPATPRQAALAVAAGEAMWRSVASGLPVSVADLLEPLEGGRE